MQEKVVDGITTVPFISIGAIEFLTLDAFLYTATLAVGLVSAVFSLFFHVRRWWRGRKRDKAANEANSQK